MGTFNDPWIWGAKWQRKNPTDRWIGEKKSSPLVNSQLDPENHPFLMETNLPTPMTARVYVNLLEGKTLYVNRDWVGSRNVRNSEIRSGDADDES